MLVDGSPQKNGGHIRVCIDGRQQLAHRAAWEDAHGLVPAGLWVLHHCDVSACVRLSHLYLGDARDNVRDRVARQRGGGPATGEQHHGARLTWEKVRAIRAAYADGASQRVLAAEYGVAQMTISKIVRGETWVCQPC